jgi:hypothetical protein
MTIVRTICCIPAHVFAMASSILVLVGCHRDPPLPPVDDGICRDHWIWNPSPPDTLRFGDASSSHWFELAGLPGYSGDTRIYLSYQHQDVNPGPGTYLARTVRLASGLDSIGYHPYREVNTNCSASRLPGDTIDPFAQVSGDFTLYSNYTSNCTATPPTWLVGFAKVIRNKRHSGYVRVRYFSGKYFIDEVRIAKCPGLRIIMEEM